MLIFPNSTAAESSTVTQVGVANVRHLLVALLVDAEPAGANACRGDSKHALNAQRNRTAERQHNRLREWLLCALPAVMIPP